MDNKFLKRIIRIITFIVFLTMISALISGFILYRSDKKNLPESTSKPIAINGTYFTDEDKTVKKLPKDYLFDVDGHRTITATGHLNKSIEKNQLLLMRIDNLKIKIYINDKLVYDINNKNKHDYIRSPGNSWYEYVSPGITPKDKITFELSNVYTDHVNLAYQEFFEKMYYGYSNDLIVNSLKSNIPNMFISIMIICMGSFVAIYAFSVYKLKKTYRITISFACLAFTSGLWLFVDFDSQSFLIPYLSLNNTIDFISMMLIAAFLFFNISTFIKNKGKFALDISGSLILITTIVILTLQLLGFADVYDFMALIKIIAIMLCVEIMAVLIYELKKYPSKNVFYIFIAYSCIFVGIIADLICNFFELLPMILWFKIGFLAFIIIQFILILRSFKDFFLETANIQALKKERDSFERIVQYQKLITEATHGLYENIYEMDITHDKANSEETEKYFESLGIPKKVPYSKALIYIANKQIKEEFREGYLKTFSPENIRKTFKEGKKSLQYEFMISNDNKHYHWVRIIARIFFWEADKSIHIIVYHQNIDSEKKKERNLRLQATKDLLTNLDNKISTENEIKNILAHTTDKKYAFIIIDIDNFKDVNDNFGHAAGDKILVEFARTLKKQFRQNDLVGRVGGDEFVAFIQFSNIKDIETKGKQIVKSLNKKIKFTSKTCHISSSVGISIFPDDGDNFKDLYKNADRALYHTKHKGKNGFAIYKNID